MPLERIPNVFVFPGRLWPAPTTSPPPKVESSSCVWSSPPPSRRSVRRRHGVQAAFHVCGAVCVNVCPVVSLWDCDDGPQDFCLHVQSPLDDDSLSDNTCIKNNKDSHNLCSKIKLKCVLCFKLVTVQVPWETSNRLVQTYFAYSYKTIIQAVCTCAVAPLQHMPVLKRVTLPLLFCSIQTFLIFRGWSARKSLWTTNESD